MSVLLLTGVFGSPDAWALNDFESESTGDITDELYTFLGTTTYNGCTWGEARFGSRA